MINEISLRVRYSDNMPTYGYECTACKDQFEIFQSIKDDALTTCEKCGGGLRKRIYPVGIAFKGSGFYVNDYAKPPAGGAGASTASDTSAEGGSKPDAPAAAESKPAAETKAPAETKSSVETKSAAGSTPAAV